MSLTPEQIENRKTGIGGSEAATILGLNPYQTPFELWQIKTGRAAAPDLSDNFAVKRGNDMEALVAKWFAEEMNVTVRRDNETKRHPEHDFIIGHIDRRIVGEQTGLECKTANWRMLQKFGEAGTDEVPAYYLIQCVHYMVATGWRKWWLAADIGGEFRVYPIAYDEALANHLVSRVADFWHNHVVADVPPAPTSMKEIDLRYAKADAGAAVEASEAIIARIDELGEVTAQKKALTETEEAIKAEIKLAMADAQILMGNGRKLATWANQTRRSFNQKQFAADYPELVETYQTTTEFRTLRVNS